MANFLFVYRNNVEAENAEPSPEEMQQVLAAWGEWFQKLGDAVIDGGDGLMPAGKQVGSDGTITDGPFVEAKELVGGYSILQANTIEQAAEYAQSCPVLHHGGKVEVRELAGYTTNSPN